MKIFLVYFFTSISFVCNATLAEDPVAVAPLIGLKSDSPITSLSSVSALVEILSVSAFLLNTPDGEYWITVSQPMASAESPYWQFYILFPPHSLRAANTIEDLLRILKTNGIPIDMYSNTDDSILDHFTAELGSDFLKIQKVRNLKNSFLVDGLKAFDLRPLITQPLEYGESLTISGVMNGRVWNNNCTFIGYNAYKLFTLGALSMVLDCQNVPATVSENGVKLELGGTSGGPIRDENGKVVGVFTGSLGFSLVDPHRWFLTGSPIFIDYDNKIRPFPYPNQNGFPDFIDLGCYDFFVDGGPSMGQILDSPILFRFTCRFKNDGQGLEFQLIDYASR